MTPGSADTVRERPLDTRLPVWAHVGWGAEFPWLVQGTTGRGSEQTPFDLGLSGSEPVGVVLARWRELLRELGVPTGVHSRQVHGGAVWLHRGSPAPGLLLMSGFDGHVTDVPGLLLTVSIADCVPVFLLDPRRRAIALLHAGWRGVAANVLEEGIRQLTRSYGSAPAELRLHCGPAICGSCYEVGPEVHRALGLPEPPAPRPIDLVDVLLQRARALGIPGENCSRSAFCTRCGQQMPREPRPFFSHRAGEPQRQMALLGIRPLPLS